MSTSPIETRRVTLETMSITIKAMQVDRRQLTLSTFRQLPEAVIIGADGRLDPSYALWGTVKYTTKKTTDDTVADFWIVGSRDGRLYRAPYPALPASTLATIEEEQRVARLFSDDMQMLVKCELEATWYDKEDGKWNSEMERLRERWQPRQDYSPYTLLWSIYYQVRQRLVEQASAEVVRLANQHAYVARLLATHKVLNELEQLFIAT